MVNLKEYDEVIDGIEYIASPNFSSRQNSPIDMIIIHYTAATRISGTLDWFKRPESKVSAHYVIGRDGRIVQMVADEDKAWHAGYSYWDGLYSLNKNSIGIELVGTATTGFTNEQYTALTCLCLHLINKYSIRLDRIIGHEDCSGEKARKKLLEKNYPYIGKVDPGPNFSWATLMGNIDLFNDQYDEEPVETDIDPEEYHKPSPNMDAGIVPEEESLFFKIIYIIMRIFRLGESDERRK